MVKLIKFFIIVGLILTLNGPAYGESDFSEEATIDADYDESPVFTLDVSPNIELWHYSGGHWGKNPKILDEDLKYHSGDVVELALEIAKQHSNDSKTIWTFPVDSITIDKLKQLKLDQGYVEVNLKSRINGVDVDEILITKENDTEYHPEFEVDFDKSEIRLICYPKFNFSKLYNNYELVTADTKFRLGGTIIPVIKSDFGYNRYSVFGTNNFHYDAANATHEDNKLDSDTDTHDIYYGDISIRGSETYVDAGIGREYLVAVTHSEHSNGVPSTKLTIGNQTFHAGGAVAIHFDYPMTIEIYAKSSLEFQILHNDIDVTDNSDSPIMYQKDSSVQVTIENLSELKNVSEYKWYKQVNTNWELIETKTDTSPVTVSVDTNIVPIKLVAVKTDNSTVSVEHSLYLQSIGEVSETADFTIDYNQLSKSFSYEINGSSGVNLDSDSAPGRNGTWTENLSGTYDVSYSPIAHLTNNHAVLYNSVSTGGNSASTNPRLNFTSDRAYFGEEPDRGVFGSDGSKKASFHVSGQGSDSRDYKYEKEVKKTRENSEGETISYWTYEWRNGTKPVHFSPNVSTDVSVLVKTYNGSRNNPSVSISDRETSNSSFRRDFTWEGPSLPFFVSRTMYEADNRSVEVPGKYERYFQPENTGSVQFEPVNSSFYDTFRNKNQSVRGLYVNAPYTMTKETYSEYQNSQRMTLKSGYFYELFGEYKATVYTKTYVKGRSSYDFDDTGHQSIVNQIKKDFSIVSNIPTVSDAKDRSVKIPSYTNQSGNITVTITDNKTTNASKVAYGSSLYTRNMESSPSYLYDEFVSTKSLSELSGFGIYSGFNLSKAREDIYVVEETTEITFRIPLQKNYVDINTADGSYYIGAYLKGVEIDAIYTEDNRDFNMSSIPKSFLSSSKQSDYFSDHYYYNFVISGNMYEDAYIDE